MLSASGTKYSRVDQIKFYKGCLSHNLLGPLLNTLSHMWIFPEMYLSNVFKKYLFKYV